MKCIALATTVVIASSSGCSDNADIGVNTQPVTCLPAAGGAANGSVTNQTTHTSYTFGSTQASLIPATLSGPIAVGLSDSSLALRLMFPCGQPQLGTYDAADPRMSASCPFTATGSVSGHNQTVYAASQSGTLIVDQNVGCLAGRYDIDFGLTENGAYVDQGRVAGWFSVPAQ